LSLFEKLINNEQTEIIKVELFSNKIVLVFNLISEFIIVNFYFEKTMNEKNIDF